MTEATKQTTDDQPWRDRDWRMIRQYRIDYPQRMVYDVEPSEGDPLGRFHYEDDRSQQPAKTEIFPIFLERNPDGSYTGWKYSLYGPIGQTGTLTPQAEAKLETVHRRRDKHKLEQFIQILERSDKTGNAVAGAMLAASNGRKQ